MPSYALTCCSTADLTPGWLDGIDIASAVFSDSFDHLKRGFFADSAESVQRIPAHSQKVHFGLIAVRDKSAVEHS